MHRSARPCRLAERQHQAVGPVEEGARVDHVDDVGAVETARAERKNIGGVP
jgi:hypothetical protein